ncbi:cytochrome c biogenesis CcdA family protein [Paenibacillus antarcticus]|uniref:cytochrome c biogenesis CcdA family protein n=1 Tax=Paenibacillus antarcticus TaxID=253703 RepID=UPI000837E724|nr:cytochrome c biogenesis protein CcdA [Paenibacillus antarcticus]
MLTEQVYVGSVFIAGILSFFSPCILPLLPVYLAFLGGSDLGNQSKMMKLGKLKVRPLLIGNMIFFLLGISTVFILLGYGAGAFGSVIDSSWFIVVCGAIVVLFGIYQTGVIKLFFMEREKKLHLELKGNKGLVGAYLLGFTFSFGWTPCIGPVLAAVLSISASEGSSAFGGWLMLIYTLGLAIPFLILSLFSDLLLQRLKKLYRYMGTLKVISGIILILMGFLLMTNKLNMITTFFEFNKSIGG